MTGSDFLASTTRTYYVINWPAVQACVTFFAVLVALFNSRFWKWWNRPKLDLSFAPIAPPGGGGLAELPRLHVRNKGNDAAKKVRLTLSAVFSRVDDVWVSAAQEMGIDLLWPPYEWQHLDILASQTSRSAKLGGTNTEARRAEAIPFLIVKTNQGPNVQHRCGEGKHILHLILSGSNFKARQYLIGIEVGTRPNSKQGWFTFAEVGEQTFGEIKQLRSLAGETTFAELE